MPPTLENEPPILGVCQWFHFQEEHTLQRTIRLMHKLGLTHLRTGVSWADFHRPGGRAWYDHQMEALSEFDVLLSVWHTPPSLGEAPSCAAPPRRLQDYADFIDLLINEYGHQFNDIELWNEPNNLLKWNFRQFDPQWTKFSHMIAMAANWARRCGKRTVLGGMIPVDPHWLRLIEHHGALDFIDVVAIHGFPGMWWSHAPNWDWHAHWDGWDEKVRAIQNAAGERPIWITETGLATWDGTGDPLAKSDLQAQMLADASTAPVQRVYWYSMIDLDPARPAIEGHHVDENEYHLGLETWDGHPKPAMHVLRRLATEQHKLVTTRGLR